MARFDVLKLFIVGVTFTLCVGKRAIDLNSFPAGFLIGTASSSYQTEGAWDEEGKSENIWDYFTHNYPEKIADESNGDTACNSYEKYKEDIALLKEIGVDHYRFSLSWSRILPTGYTDNVNQEGVQYYHNILDELEKYNIIPIVTIYHWDHPESLENIGGWMNVDMAYAYSEYAKFVFGEFGNRVKIFVTINEPGVFCTKGYTSTYAPGFNLTGVGPYICLQNMLKGHALAYRAYDNQFRGEQGGIIGIAIQCVMPYSQRKNDKRSVDVAFEFECGWQANPIFSRTGDYPEIMKKMIAKRSKSQRYFSSRLPTLSPYWIKLIRGSADFFGLNHYTSHVVSRLPRSYQAYWPNDEGLSHSFDPSWPSSQIRWLKSNPKGLGDILRMIKSKYRNPPVFILENGVADGSGTEDNFRINYLYSYMQEMLIAMKQDKCNVKAYTVWSFLDGFEWDAGYTAQFGLVNVDFSDADLKRTLKKSALWLKSVLATRRLQTPTL